MASRPSSPVGNMHTGTQIAKDTVCKTYRFQACRERSTFKTVFAEEVLWQRDLLQFVKPEAHMA